jgi:acetylornithine deacetylase/succinyl-diaminopimelate desuccinylase-like protein
MKGQVHAFLKALEALIKHEALKVNVKVLVEGEEEIGSPNLGAFMEQNKDLLKCDFSLNADSGILRPDLPSITYGLRGLAYFGGVGLWPFQDKHSGVFGGSIHNPAQVLCGIDCRDA